jgi:hypothetical protein
MTSNLPGLASNFTEIGMKTYGLGFMERRTY